MSSHSHQRSMPKVNWSRIRRLARPSLANASAVCPFRLVGQRRVGADGEQVGEEKDGLWTGTAIEVVQD